MTEQERRIAQGVAQARRALELPDEVAPAPDAETVRTLITAIESRLEADGDDDGWRAASAAHADDLERLRRRYEARAEALRSAREAVGLLRELTSPSEILAAAPERLCGCSRLDRAVLSLIRNGFLVAHAAHFGDDDRGAELALEALRADPPRLEHQMIETELLRRRRATLVTGARVHPRLAEVVGWDAYVAAPVLLGDAIAVIHADRRSGPPLDVLDGDVVWTFANGLADAFESASLHRSLRTQRAEMRAFVEWLGARSAELSDPTIELVPEHEPTPAPPGSLDVIASARVDDRVVFEHVLTRRELDVLRLLVRGESNQGIAAQLVISPATVKFHVGNILDKLRVSNRAQAVSRYHRLVETGAREDA